jgi:hypothetical protein
MWTLILMIVVFSGSVTGGVAANTTFRKRCIGAWRWRKPGSPRSGRIRCGHHGMNSKKRMKFLVCTSVQTCSDI